jgi:hypothetical protein
MPARKKPYYMYCVFVSTKTNTSMVYFGSSKPKAQTELAKAVMNNPYASSVEIRCDFQLLVRALIERP